MPSSEWGNGGLTIPAPGSFSFWRTVYSHGWCTLPPFLVDKELSCLHRLLRLQDGSLVYCTLSDGRRVIDVKIRSKSSLSQKEREEIRRQIASCFRFEDDLMPFFRAAQKDRRFRWVRSTGSGRLLRSPTVFEDIVKMMCTTNCSWALTEVMTRNLTTALGEKFTDGVHAFPTAAQLAGVTDSFMRSTIRSGYRSPYLIEFADNVASGRMDVEGWRNSGLSTETLFKEVQSIKGIGEYAAGNLLRLLGRYDYLALDSWVRSKYSQLHHKGRKVSDRTIERAYRKYGEWRGLFFWLEMTKNWTQHKFPF